MANMQLHINPTPLNSEEADFDPNTLDVIIRDPDKVVFKGKAVAVSTKNSVGPMDILPQHENFISIVTDFITVWTDKDHKQEIKTDKAVVKAEHNKIIIYTGVESLTTEVMPVQIKPLGLSKKA
ncbi:MAG: hypothetical protein ACM3IJ_00920 [Candidatus Levyibacteriota bacterium]